MSWSRKLRVPIKLKDGREIATLGQGREVMLALPERHQARPFWQSAAELLIDRRSAAQPRAVGRRAALMPPIACRRYPRDLGAARQLHPLAGALFDRSPA